MAKSTFSRSLKRIREEFNMSKADMARELGIPYTTYNGYEEGLREPKFQTIEQIAKRFGYNSFDLLLANSKYITEETAEFLITLCGYTFTSIDENQFLVQEIENGEIKRGKILDHKALDNFIKDISNYTTFTLNNLLN